MVILAPLEQTGARYDQALRLAVRSGTFVEFSLSVKPESEDTMNFSVGDWVQATAEISEPDFIDPQTTWIHARRNAIGHVLEILEGGDVVNVYWERSGTITICFPDELKRLCGCDAGQPTVRTMSDSRS